MVENTKWFQDQVESSNSVTWFKKKMGTCLVYF